MTAGAGVITGNGTATVTIAGTAAQINTALAGLAYTGNLNFNGADTLTVATIDGTAADIDTIAITVNPVNDAPALNLDADGSTTGGVDYLTTFTGSAVAIVDTDVSVVDNDSPSLASATITLTNPHAGDSLIVATPPLPGGITASVYNPVTGVLTLTGAASAADYQTALRQITFDTTTPSTETRIIDVVVNDGTAASNIAHAIVEVTQVDSSAPTLDLDGNNSTLPGTNYHTTFTENGTAVAIADTDTLIGDPDIGSTIASATITLTNPQIGDLLTATLPLPGGITASAYNPATGILTLSGVASFADYETALEAIRFSSAGDNPVAGSRIIQVVVNDGIHDSQPAISLVRVVAANDAPALVVADATYQENAAPVLLSPALSLTDADDTELNFAAVQITAGSFPGDGDTLTVNGATSGTVTGITFAWNPTSHALILSGASLVADYHALLQSVQFHSTSDNPTDFDASPQRTLTWFVSDGTAVTTATTTLDIVAVNDPPINTVPAAVTVAEDSLQPIAGVSVADIDSSALTTTLSVAHGILNVTDAPGVTGNGTAHVTIAGTATQINTALAGLAYAGGPDFLGRDTLTVATNDGTATDTDTIAITVTPVNDAPVAVDDGPLSTAEDTPLNNIAVLLNDTDVELDPLSVSGTPTALNGTVTVNPDGTLNYTPAANYNGPDTITYTVTDGSATDTGQVAIAVTPVNDAPVALDDGPLSTAEDTPLNNIAVLLNDTDVELDPLSVSGTPTALNGTVTVNPDGTLNYTPAANYNGPDTITYTVTDGSATDTGQVAITVTPVNDAPAAVAVDDAATVAEGAAVTTVNVLGNDTDPDNTLTAASITAFTQGTHGSVVSNNDGTFTYTHDGSETTSDSFTYTASDGAAGSNIATVTMTVNPVNDPPVNTVPGPQSAEPDTDTPIAGLAIQDIDAGTNIIQTTLSVSHGTLVVTPSGGAAVAGNGTNTVVVTGSLSGINATLAATGLVVYRSFAGFVGTDMLIITTTDEADASDTDTVAINVGGNAPAGIVLSNTTINEFSQDGTLVGSLAAIDADPGDTFTFALLDDAGARFAINGTSLIVRHGLLLDFEQAAAHAITVEVTDSSGARFQQVFTIGIANVDPEIITQSGELSGPGLASVTGGITIVGGPLDDRISLAGGNDTIDAGAGNDMLIGGPGDDRLTGAAGDDTTAFTVPLGSTTPDDFGQWIDIAGADGSDRLFTIEHLQFPDGTVHVNDGDLLFDTLFYDHRYLDVFHAVVDAGQHYAEFGWHEGRDPNAFFSTTQYLSANRVFQPEPEPEPDRNPNPLRHRACRLTLRPWLPEANRLRWSRITTHPTLPTMRPGLPRSSAIRWSTIATSGGARGAILRSCSTRRSI